MFLSKIQSGSAHVIDSGIVFQFFDSPITLNLELPDFAMEVVFKFETKKNENTDLFAEVINSSKLEFRLINFENNLGTNLKTPIKIADYQDDNVLKYVYLTFNVVKQSPDSDRYLMYTFFLSEELK